MEGKMIVGESSSEEFQIMDKVLLDEFNPEKIRIVEAGLKDDELQRVKGLEGKGLNVWTEFPWFDNAEVIRVILSRVRDNCIVLDKPYPIRKEIISMVTSLCDNGEVPAKKLTLNKEMEALTGVKGDQQALVINTIVNPVVRYVAYGISYKVYFRNREGATSAIVVYMAYMFVMENISFDLCELLKELLLESIKMTKEKNYAFRYGSLLVSLVMYCLEFLSAKDIVIWESGVPIARQIFKYLNSLDNRE